MDKLVDKALDKIKALQGTTDIDFCEVYSILLGLADEAEEKGYDRGRNDGWDEGYYAATGSDS